MMDDENKNREQLIRELERLRQSEQQYRRLLDEMSDGYVITQDEHIVFANRRMKEMLGDPPGDIVGRPWAHFLSPDTADYIEQTPMADLPPLLDVKVRRWDGSELEVELAIRPATFADQLAEFTVVRDITQRRQIETLTRIQRDLGTALSATSDLDRALHLCLEAAISVSGMDSGGVYLVDEQSGALELASAKGLSRALVESASYFEADSLQANLVQTGRPTYTTYEELGVTPDHVRRSAGLKAIACIPVRHSNRVIACLNVSSHAVDQIPVTARNALEAIATQIGSAIARLKAEEALRESEALKFRTMADFTHDWEYWIAPDGNLVYISPSCQRITGYQAQEFLQNPRLLEEITHPADREIISEHQCAGLRNEAAISIDFRIITRGGRTRWIGHVCQPVYGVDGEWLGRRVSNRDITERKQAEIEIKERTNQLDALRRLGLELTAQLDLNTLLRSIVSQAVELLGGDAGGLYLYRPEEDLLEWVLSIGPNPVPLGSTLQRGEGLSGKIRETGEPLIVEDYRLWEGQARIYEDYALAAVIGAPIRWGDEFLGVLNVGADAPRTFSDDDVELLELFTTPAAIAIRNAKLYEAAQQEIAERERAEHALRESEERYRFLIENQGEGICIVGSEERFIFANRVAEEILGVPPGGLLGQSLREFMSSDQFQAIQKQIQVRRAGFRGTYETEIIRPDGEKRQLLVTATPWLNEHGQFIGSFAIFRDATERKKAEESLRRRTLELGLLNRASQALISTLDLDAVLTTLLDELRHLLGVAACSVWLIEPEGDELVCHHATGPRSEVLNGWRLALGEGLAGWVAEQRQSLIVANAQTDPRHSRDVGRRTGLALRSILSVPLHVTTGVIGVLQALDSEADYFKPEDLAVLEPLAATAAMAIENARLYEQARRDAETRAVLLNEVNHRVKNNLSTIVGLLYAARRYVETEKQPVYQSIMNDLVSRVQGLATVHSMLSASQWSPLPLSKLTTQAIRSALQALPGDKRVSVNVTPSPVRVTPDQASNLALVINELTTNTIKYALSEQDSTCIDVHIDLEGDRVKLKFRDDGPGYPEEVKRLERHSAGFDLIQNIVRKSLRGELALHNDHGAVTTFQFDVKASARGSNQ